MSCRYNPEPLYVHTEVHAILDAHQVARAGFKYGGWEWDANAFTTWAEKLAEDKKREEAAALKAGAVSQYGGWELDAEEHEKAMAEWSGSSSGAGSPAASA
ncbi:hypothetical protein IAT38_007542 [Cryptococcus sp. DSM 104549]